MRTLLGILVVSLALAQVTQVQASKIIVQQRPEVVKAAALIVVGRIEAVKVQARRCSATTSATYRITEVLKGRTTAARGTFYRTVHYYHPGCKWVSKIVYAHNQRVTPSDVGKSAIFYYQYGPRASYAADASAHKAAVLRLLGK